MDFRTELLHRWRTRHEEYARLDVFVNDAKLIDLFLIDLDTLFTNESDQLVTLRYAANISGYSVDHLARLIRDERIPNAGRPHAPRIRLGDLPRKTMTRPRASGYDVEADAAALLQLRHSR